MTKFTEKIPYNPNFWISGPRVREPHKVLDLTKFSYTDLPYPHAAVSPGQAHCWASGPTMDHVFSNIDELSYADCNTPQEKFEKFMNMKTFHHVSCTCLLKSSHNGPHCFVWDNEIQVSFNE